MEASGLLSGQDMCVGSHFGFWENGSTSVCFIDEVSKNNFLRNGFDLLKKELEDDSYSEYLF